MRQILKTTLGIELPKPGDDTLADRTLRAALAMSAVAHNKLRENLRSDPFFGAVICKALGCRHDGCAEPLPAIAARVEQVPKVIDRIADREPPVPQRDQLP